MIAFLICLVGAVVNVPFMLDGRIANAAAFGWCAALAVANLTLEWTVQ